MPGGVVQLRPGLWSLLLGCRDSQRVWQNWVRMEPVPERPGTDCPDGRHRQKARVPRQGDETWMIAGVRQTDFGSQNLPLGGSLLFARLGNQRPSRFRCPANPGNQAWVDNRDPLFPATAGHARHQVESGTGSNKGESTSWVLPADSRTIRVVDGDRPFRKMRWIAGD